MGKKLSELEGYQHDGDGGQRVIGKTVRMTLSDGEGYLGRESPEMSEGRSDGVS